MASQQSRYSRDDGPLNEAKSQFEAPAWLEARGIRVKRSGSSVLIHCPDPNHEDSHPSCSLKRYPAGWGWKCFSCSSSGNSIQLVQMLTGVSAADAIAEVHKFSGVPMPKWGGGGQRGNGRDHSWASSGVSRGRISDNKQSGYRNNAGEGRSNLHQPVRSSHAPSQNGADSQDVGGSLYAPDDALAAGEPALSDGWVDEADLCELYGSAYDPQLYEDSYSYDPYEDWGEQPQLPEPLLVQGRVPSQVFESTLTAHPLGDSFERLLITEETARRFENISDEQADKLQKICHYSRTAGNTNNLLNLWLEQRGWSPEVASKVDIHVATRVFRDTRLQVVRHPFYGVGHRLLGWSDRVQSKDRKEKDIKQRWLANVGPTPPPPPPHSSSGHPRFKRSAHRHVRRRCIGLGDRH